MTVRDKCDGVLCNKDYCEDGLSLEGLDPGWGVAGGATVAGTCGIFIILILCSCFCRPKSGSVQIENDGTQPTAVELVNQRNDTSASIQNDNDMIKPAKAYN